MDGKLALIGGEPVRRGPLGRWPIITEEEVEAVVQVLRRGVLCSAGGVEVPRLEEEFADFNGVKHAIAVSSGTAALDIAVAAAGVGPGDEVITTPYSFIASATCILHNGAIPIFSDVDPETRCLDPEAVRKCISEKTKAIIPVHLGGHPADMDPIMELAEENGLIVIEDCAQAHAAEYKGRKVGAIGHLGCFSFQQSKNMMSGEGGMITTNDEDLALKCRSLRTHGRVEGKPWYYHHRLGWNYRMTEVEAAICRVQLRRLPRITEQRRENARYLSRKLEGIRGIRPPYVSEDVKHAYHLYCINYDPAEVGISKGHFVRAVNAEGIPLTEGYAWPLYENSLFKEMNARPKGCPFTCSLYNKNIEYPKGLCPASEKLCYETGLWLHGAILNVERHELDDVAYGMRKVVENVSQIRSLA